MVPERDPVEIWNFRIYFSFALYFYINMLQDYPIQINVMNELGQKSSKNNQKVVRLHYL